MGEQAGPAARAWCRTPLTHWKCSGYRTDHLSFGEVEGICSCTCHRLGSHAISGRSRAQQGAEDPERYERAVTASWKHHAVAPDRRAAPAEGEVDKLDILMLIALFLVVPALLVIGWGEAAIAVSIVTVIAVAGLSRWR